MLLVPISKIVSILKAVNNHNHNHNCNHSLKSNGIYYLSIIFQDLKMAVIVETLLMLANIKMSKRNWIKEAATLIRLKQAVMN